ncbi:MAG: GNAT family N-acetyltransferase [Burkholderiaceae bacterium]
MNISIRPAAPSDLDGINAVIGSAIDTWGLPARVRAHSGPMFALSAGELADLQALVTIIDARVCAVATWLGAGESDIPPGARKAGLLHGLYVAADCHRQGIGKALLNSVIARMAADGHDVVSTRAQRAAEGFFLSRGFAPFPNEGGDILYPRRLWRSTVAQV